MRFNSIKIAYGNALKLLDIFCFIQDLYILLLKLAKLIASITLFNNAKLGILRIYDG